VKKGGCVFVSTTVWSRPIIVRISRAIFLAVLRRPRSLVTGVSLVCVLLVALAVAPGAFASTTDELRGEWKLELKCDCTFPVADTNTLVGTALISQMDLASGAFFGTTILPSPLSDYRGEIKGTVTENKLELYFGSESPVGDFDFIVGPEVMTEGIVESGGDRISGPGEYAPGTEVAEKGSIVAEKIRSWAQIEKEEEEERIKAEKEQFEREGREKGQKEGREKGEREGREKGEQEGRETAEQEVKLKAEQEAVERSAKEAQAKAEREAKEKVEKEAAEKAETQAREKIEREVREKIEKEAKELAAKEAKQKAEKQAKERLRDSGQTAVLVGKSFTVAASGQFSLQLTNANGYAISGVLTLVPSPAAATKSSVGPGGASGGTSGGAPSKGNPSKGNGTTGKAKPVVLAEAAYTIASHSSRTVQLKLSKSALAELEHHKTLQLLATVATRVGGKPSSTKTYEITLKLAPAKTPASK
jgi:hypothetical protein